MSTFGASFGVTPPLNSGMSTFGASFGVTPPLNSGLSTTGASFGTNLTTGSFEPTLIIVFPGADTTSSPTVSVTSPVLGFTL